MEWLVYAEEADLLNVAVYLTALLRTGEKQTQSTQKKD